MTESATTSTFVFTDIEGSTRLFHELGEAWLGVLDEHYTILRSTFSAHRGVEVKSEGDALFVVFDDAVDAVSACVEAQRELVRHEWSSGREIRVRMGMHTGTAFRVDDDYVGLAIHEAARVAAAGHGGQVLVSEATAALVDGRLPQAITLADLGVHALKDFGPQRLFQAAHAELPVTFPPPRTLSATEHNLPAPTTSIVGRVAEMEAVERLLLRDARLVTATGMGGIGKSRIALEVGRSLLVWFRGGVWFVEFAGVDDPSDILPTIVAALGVTEQPGKPLLDAITEHVSGSATLLVLDNLEHLLDGVVAIADLLAACPDVKVLATSRERLRLRGEHIVDLPPLDTSDAETLFVHRARAVAPGFGESEADQEAASEVARRLDGVPLAIELAAARLPDLGLAAVLAGLESSLDLLTEGERDLPPRHQAMRATLAWSYGLLDAREQAVFAALGAFAGGADPDALAAVSDVEPADIVPSLVAKGLVRRSGDDSGRVVILEVVRQFAAERLAESGREERAHAAHLAWMTDFAVRLEALAPGPAQADCLAAVDLEHDNLITAADRAPAASLQLAASLAWWWSIRGRWTEGRRVLALTLGVGADGQDDMVRAKGLIAAAHLAERQGELSEARHLAEEALRTAEEVGNAHVAALAHSQLAEVARSAGDLAEALRSCDLALDILAAGEDEPAYGRALTTRGAACGAGGDLDEAVKTFEAAREIHDRLGNHRAVALVDRNLAEILRRRGDLDAARRYVDAGLAGARQLGDAQGILVGLSHMGSIALARGDQERAVDALTSALDLARALRDVAQHAVVARNLAVLLIQTDQLTEARVVCEEVLSVLARAGRPVDRHIVLLLCDILMALGHERAAAARLLEARELGEAEGDEAVVAWVNERLRRLERSPPP